MCSCPARSGAAHERADCACSDSARSGRRSLPTCALMSDSITAWDLKFADSASAPTLAAGRLGVVAAADARSAVAEADVVISAVTAAQIGEAAHVRGRASETRCVLLRSQFHVAGCEAGGRSLDRRCGRPLRRSGHHVADRAASRGFADAARRHARRELPAAGARARVHGSAALFRKAGRGFRGQDVPQRGRSRVSRR